MKIIKLDAIDSTNSFLKKKMSNSEIDDFTIVYSQNQFKGRGRTTKQWISEPNKNIAISLFKRFKKSELQDLFILNVIISISILELLKKSKIKINTKFKKASLSFLNIKFLSNKILALLTACLVIFVAIRMGITLIA